MMACCADTDAWAASFSELGAPIPPRLSTINRAVATAIANHARRFARRSREAYVITGTAYRGSNTPSP